MHEVTLLVTVSALRDASIEVMVIDERSGSEAPMTFRVTEETTVYRGDVALVVRLAGHEHH